MAYFSSIRFSAVFIVLCASQPTAASAAEADLCLLQSSKELESLSKKSSSHFEGQQNSKQPMVSATHARSAALVQGHHASSNKWVDHGNFKATKMDQATLPADSKHVRMKTMTADWHQEYPTAAPMNYMTPVKGAASGLSIIFFVLSMCGTIVL